MADFYVNYSTGNDVYDGTQETYTNDDHGPKKHISSMIDALVLPISEETTIHLAGTIADPQDYYDDDDPAVNIEGVRCVGDGSLIIQPAIWNENNYNQLCDPFNSSNGTGNFDPKTEDRPCLVPPFLIKGSDGIVLKGLGFFSDSNDKEDIWLMVYGGSRAEIHYCLANNAKVGFAVTDFSNLEVYNSCSENNDEGMMAYMRAMLSLFGANYILNCRRVGIRVKSNSTLTLTCWYKEHPELFMTDIRTTDPRNGYTGVAASEQSLIKIIEKLLEDGDIDPAYLTIINENTLKPTSYKGVTLEEMSLLVGKDKIIFSEEDLNEGKATVLPSCQIVAAAGEGCLSTD